eukprot:Phypoly_transcript_15203.p1 GENE.Phypoly_transcript_15203~~Phypoly_transcript_15203.p1  ORF type:complete len:178 (+),score=35.52 Phypoly_transcript_15203:167-700(+)
MCLFFVSFIHRPPASGLDLETLAPIKIPAERQIFDSFLPKLGAINLAIDTAGLLIRIDRIVKGSNLFLVQPNSDPPNSEEAAQERDEQEETQVQSLHRGFRPARISDGATARAQQQSSARKTAQEKKFYSKEQAEVRQRAEIFYKQHVPQDKITQRKRIMQLAKKEKERISKEANDE